MARDETVRAAVRAALNDIGPRVVADAQRLCSAAYPPASAGGDFPRRRSGRLAGGFGFRIEEGPNGPVFVLYNTAPHAGFVNDGTGRMAARPYLKLTMDKWGPVLTRATADAIAKAQGQSAPRGRAGGGVRGFAGRVASAVAGGVRSLFGR